MRVVAQVLGPIRVVVNGGPVELGGPRQRRLLAALLARWDSVVPTDGLIEATFDGSPPAGAARTFRTYVARLRRALDLAGLDAATIVTTRPPGYVIPADSMELDAFLFEEALADARDQLAAGEADSAVLRLSDGLALWSGPAYGEFADEAWIRAEARRLDELRRIARELQAEALLASGQSDAVIPEIESLVDEEPFREGPRRLLALALYRSGRHAEALRSLREFADFLGDETGLQPSDELLELENLILDRDPRLDVRPLGRKLRGYLLGRPVAESLEGVTYVATQPSIGRDVEITVIDADHANDPDFIRRFELHAQRIASIEHPNVVPLYDYWREPGGAYLVTRYLDGGSLADRLGTGELSRQEIVAIVQGVGQGLGASHQRGVAHGQLSASRIRLDGSGTPILTGYRLDVDHRQIVGDLGDLARLAVELLSRSEAITKAGRSADLIQARISTLTARADGTTTDLPFATAAEVVEAFEAIALEEAPPAGPPSSEAEPATRIEGPNPYRGLLAFTETDADLLFGRDRFVDQLDEDLGRHPFLAVVGPSGSGKSSAVLAGLLPRLRDRGWYVATMSPGERPLAELEIALARIATRPVPALARSDGDVPRLASLLPAVLGGEDQAVVLVVDQLEEAFTVSDPAERDRFFGAVTQALDTTANLHVVATARADFLGPILEHDLIGPLVRDHSRLITPLNAEELHTAIVGPAELVGVAVEPALASALVADTASAPGSLPLLQYALTELFEHRADGTLTMSAYRRIGGVGAVLAQRADEIFGSLDVSGQRAARGLFSRLVVPGEGAEDTRRRARRSELIGVSDGLLRRFGAARLLAFDRDPATREPTVEVAHEALLRQWPRLQGWLDEDRDKIRALRHLTTSAADWEVAGRDESELYRGARLATAEEWADAHDDELTAGEREFLDASVSARDAERDLEVRRNRRLRALLAVVAAVAAVAVLAGTVAVQRGRSADASAEQAELRRIIAESQTFVGDDRSRALLLALEAHRLSPSADSLGALQRAIAGSPHNWLGDIVTGRPYYHVEFLPDGPLAAITDEGLEIWDIAERRRVAQLPIDGTPIDLDLSTDGSRIALAVSEGRWWVIDAQDLSEIRWGDIGERINIMRFDASGSTVALGHTSGLVSLRGVDDRALDLELPGVGGLMSDLVFHPNGKRVAAAGDISGVARQWDTTNGEQIGGDLTGVNGVSQVLYANGMLYGGVNEVQAYDQDTTEPVGAAVPLQSGNMIGGDTDLLASDDDELMVVSPDTIETIDLGTGTSAVAFFDTLIDTLSGALSPDGRLAAFTGPRGISLWAPNGPGIFADGVVPATGFINHLSTDGRTAFSGGFLADPTRIWDLTGSVPRQVLSDDGLTSYRMVGGELVRYERTGVAPDTVIEYQRWRRQDRSFAPLTPPGADVSGVNQPAFTPGGHGFVIPRFDTGRVDVFDVDSQALIASLDDVTAELWPLAASPNDPVFTPDERRLVVPYVQEWVAVYDAETWELVELLDPSDGFAEIAFTAEGDLAITHSARGVEYRDPADLRRVLRGPVPGERGPDGIRMLEVTSDGRLFKTSGGGGAQLWDVETMTRIGGPFRHDGLGWAATMAADANLLGVAVEEDFIIWDIDIDSWADKACLAAGRNLTQDEWDQFGPRGDYHATCPHWT